MFGRKKCIMKKVTPQSHDEFIDRIRKSLYFGGNEDMQLSLPLASYASELFSSSHTGYSLNRLCPYTVGKIQASPCSLIMAIIFLERLNATDPCYVRKRTPQELFIVSMMISTKFYLGYDEEIYFSDWASEGNISEDKLKQLELEFLCAIDWNIYISNEEFFKKLDHVEAILAEREGLRRGWLTYTELMHTMPSFALAKLLLNTLVNHLTVMLVSYAAGVLTIAGAFLLASQIPGHALHRGKNITTSNTDESSNSTQLDVINQNQGESNRTATTAPVVTLSTAAARNTTCSALNVEAELLKLDQQYRKEEEELNLRSRNNEMSQASYMTLPVRSLNKQLQISSKSDKQERKWLAFKNVYSEGYCRMKTKQNHVSATQVINQMNEGPWHLVDRFKDSDNRSSFWQMFSGATQQSFVRLPLLWFKFI